MRSDIRLGCGNATCNVLPEDVHEKVIVIWNGQAKTFVSKDVLTPISANTSLSHLHLTFESPHF